MRANHGLDARQLVKLFCLLGVPDEDRKVKVAGIRMLQESCENSAADVACAARINR